MRFFPFSLALLCFALVLPSFLIADEPMSVGWSIVAKAGQKGAYKLGKTRAGDHTVTVALFNANPELKSATLLVVFPGCGQDPQIDGKPIINLEEIILNKDSASPRAVSGWVDPGPRWTVCPDRSAVLIRPRKRVKVELTVDFLRAVSEGLSPRLNGNVYIVGGSNDGSKSRAPAVRKDQGAGGGAGKTPLDAAELLAHQYANAHIDSSFVIDLYYALLEEKRSWRFGSYASVFGKGEKSDVEEASHETGDYVADMNVLPVNLAPYRRTMKLPEDKTDDKGVRFEETLRLILSQGSGLPSQQTRCEDDDEFGYQPQSNRTPKLSQTLTSELSAQGSDYTISGIFSTRWSADHALHPGFGFRVEAWTNETGSWRKLASDWVQSNGTWQLTVPGSENFGGSLLRVLYRSYNDYYKPQDEDNNTYSWRDPDWLNIGTTFSTGHRYADTDGGEYNGVGELVESAMYMWSRLYWIGGINPVPDSPLNVFFPNDFYNCGGDSPWSCANTDGNVWLIAAHGTQAEVVAHEFGHQLNNKFWSKKKPAGSGGSHTLTGCYPTRLGMALREGFADFIPGWVGYPNRNVADGGFGNGRWSLDYDLESRVSPPNCADGYTNEVWVARTFWDLHDTNPDGDDILWFVHRGGVPSIYLANSIANDGDARDMRDYENIYRDAASDGHEGFISDIFDQNRQ